MPANPFDDAALANRYEVWYTVRGRRAGVLEQRLLAALLAYFPQAETLLEVGCGTGHFARWLAQRGYRVTGLDLSPVMLAEAAKRNGLPYIVGDALELPFADRSFDIVALITTLEFVADPERALGEAARVARSGLLLGVLNRHSLLALKRRISAKSPWNAARFFSPGELVRLAHNAAGQRLELLRWQTTLCPLSALRALPLPWGSFIGMAVKLHQT
jgi:ubiquinone/menaquinone biosynthesis C-methylase UbiE